MKKSLAKLPVSLRPDAVLKKLRECEASESTEQAHLEADKIFTKILAALGYGEAVKIFWKMEKWYS